MSDLYSLFILLYFVVVNASVPYVSEFAYSHKFHPVRNPECSKDVDTNNEFIKQPTFDKQPGIEIRAVLIDGSKSFEKRDEEFGSQNQNRNIMLTMKLNNAGKTALKDELILIESVLNPIGMQKEKLLHPLIIKVKQEQLMQMYGLRLVTVINAEAREEVINKNGKNYLGCDDTDVENPTCGRMFFQGKLIPYSEGFCCSCDFNENENHQPWKGNVSFENFYTNFLSNCEHDSCDTLDVMSEYINSFSRSWKSEAQAKPRFKKKSKNHVKSEKNYQNSTDGSLNISNVSTVSLQEDLLGLVSDIVLEPKIKIYEVKNAPPEEETIYMGPMKIEKNVANQSRPKIKRSKSTVGLNLTKTEIVTNLPNATNEAFDFPSAERQLIEEIKSFESTISGMIDYQPSTEIHNQTSSENRTKLEKTLKYLANLPSKIIKKKIEVVTKIPPREIVEGKKYSLETRNVKTNQSTEEKSIKKYLKSIFHLGTSLNETIEKNEKEKIEQEDKMIRDIADEFLNSTSEVKQKPKLGKNKYKKYVRDKKMSKMKEDGKKAMMFYDYIGSEKNGQVGKRDTELNRIRNEDESCMLDQRSNSRENLVGELWDKIRLRKLMKSIRNYFTENRYSNLTTHKPTKGPGTERNDFSGDRSPTSSTKISSGTSERPITVITERNEISSEDRSSTSSTKKTSSTSKNSITGIGSTSTSGEKNDFSEDRSTLKSSSTDFTEDLSSTPCTKKSTNETVNRWNDIETTIPEKTNLSTKKNLDTTTISLSTDSNICNQETETNVTSDIWEDVSPDSTLSRINREVHFLNISHTTEPAGALSLTDVVKRIGNQIPKPESCYVHRTRQRELLGFGEYDFDAPNGKRYSRRNKRKWFGLRKKKRKGEKRRKYKKKYKRYVKYDGTQIRGGQDCMDQRSPRDVDTSKYHKSTHCLRFSNLWYSVYELLEPTIEHTVYVEIYEKHSMPDGSIRWEDLTRGSKIKIGTLNDRHETNGPSISIKYTETQIDPRTSNYDLNFKQDRLLVPLTESINPESRYPNVKEGSGEYLVLHKNSISTSGTECDKAGVGFAAFATQRNRCGRIRGTCLKNQPLTYLKHDMEAVQIGRPGCYFLSNFANVPVQPIRYNRIQSMRKPILALEYHWSHTSIIDIQLGMNNNGIVKYGSTNCCISEIHVDSTSAEHTKIVMVISNNGPKASLYEIRIVDCPMDLPKSWKKSEIGNLSPHSNFTVTFNIFGQFILRNFKCSVELLNGHKELIAVRHLYVEKMKRCFCLWHCLCECTNGSINELICRPMSLMLYHAAGFQGFVPIITSLSSSTFYWSSWMCIIKLILLCTAILLIFLLTLGLLKWLIGLIFPSIGLWGLYILLGKKKGTNKYKLNCGCIVNDPDDSRIYDNEGKNERICSRKMQFVLNLTFFLTFPVTFCCNYARNKCRSKLACSCIDTFQTGIVNEQDSGAKLVGMKTYSEDSNSDRQDTQYVLTELKRSEESLRTINNTKTHRPAKRE